MSEIILYALVAAGVYAGFAIPIYIVGIGAVPIEKNVPFMIIYPGDFK